MRKFFTLMSLVALLALAAVPTLAQEDTIADIVVASTEAEEPQFTTLLAAVQAADPAVLELLSDPEVELTVFAPTDAAFAALAEELGEEQFNALLEDPALMTAILQYHVVPSVVMSEDVVAGLEENDGSFEVASAQGIRFEVAQDEEGVITVGGAPLNMDMLDIEAANGVVHVVDAVMVPPLDTIADVVVASTEAEEPQFTTLLTAVQAADPAVLELLSDPLAGVTVFAPTDAAFEALGEETLTAVIEDQAMLTGILQYHVLPDVVYSDEVVGLVEAGPVEVEMANGAMAEVALDGENVTIAGATVVMTDIETLNGVVHVIDAVMLPPEGDNEEAAMESDDTEEDSSGY
jgi:uncharacterized surface protein with fasciclin (FAS1) repeats